MAKKRKFAVSSESESSEPASDDEGVVEISSSTSCDDDDDSKAEDEDEDYDYGDDEGSECKGSEDEKEQDGHVDIDDEESVCDKVIQFLHGKSHVRELKLVECKVFLRRHGLRISGNKKECTERIKEFWRLKDGNGEALYPRSSFVIDCTGDVCKGDVVLFNQKVYQTFNKKTRHGSVLGRRTVAGRIVKESYGSARQQHTFTVEVLWSRGTKRLAPLVPLLVKGRNLYKLKTFRQFWKNENKRLEVLSEKHQRGAAARTLRGIRKRELVTKTNKSSTSKGAKRCKDFHHPGPSAKTTKKVKNGVNQWGKAMAVKNKLNPCKDFPPFRASSSTQAWDSRGPASHRRSENMFQDYHIREPPVLLHNDHSQTFYQFQSDVNQREHNYFPSNRGPLPYPIPIPVSQHHEFNHGSFVYPGHSHSNHSYDSRFPGSMDYRSFHPSYTDTYRWR